MDEVIIALEKDEDETDSWSTSFSSSSLTPRGKESSIPEEYLNPRVGRGEKSEDEGREDEGREDEGREDEMLLVETLDVEE